MVIFVQIMKFLEFEKILKEFDAFAETMILNHGCCNSREHEKFQGGILVIPCSACF